MFFFPYNFLITWAITPFHFAHSFSLRYTGHYATLEALLSMVSDAITYLVSSFCYFFNFFYYYGSGRALNQVKPNHTCFILFYLFLFYYRGSGRALNQVKPNHFQNDILEAKQFFWPLGQCYFICNNRWRRS